MENAVEALKIAFAVMMFALALTISVSSFSNAKTSIDTIVELKDSKILYAYVEPATANKVGIETIIPTLYSAYNEDFKVIFLDSAKNPLPLYYSLDHEGKIKKDEDLNPVTINTIDLEAELHLSKTEAIEHLNMLLGKKENAEEKYKNEFIHNDGLYAYFKEHTFEEYLGEYYQEDEKAGTETDLLEVNKTKKRVITYVLAD